MQHKGITAFLTELGEGKLLGPGSAWQRSLQLQACELHAAQAEAQRCLQGWSAARLLVAQCQKETVVANAETVAAKAAGVAAAAEAERRASEKDQQHSDELKTGREDLEGHEQIAAASEANMKEQLVKARRACQIKIAKVNKMEPAAVRARTRARKQVKTIMELRAECAKLHSEAPRFGTQNSPLFPEYPFPRVDTNSTINSTTHLMIRAGKEDIKKGEEILVNYGTHYNGVFLNPALE